MTLTVRQLIAKLKKMPPSAVVALRDHDQSADEINGYVRCVEEGTDELYAARAVAEDPRDSIVVLSP